MRDTKKTSKRNRALVLPCRRVHLKLFILLSVCLFNVVRPSFSPAAVAKFQTEQGSLKPACLGFVSEAAGAATVMVARVITLKRGLD